MYFKGMITFRNFQRFCTLFLIFVLATPATAQNDSITFLALGDSYTYGASELRVNSWPIQLVSQLRKNKTTIKAPVIVAKPGWTTTDLLSGIEDEVANTKFDLVSLLIGVNNQYKNRDISIFKKEFPILLDKSIALAKDEPKNVIVLSIPDWSVTPFARFKDKSKIVKELETYNAIIKDEAIKSGTTYIDITKISRNALVNPSLMASDSLHPSKKMYRLWAKKISKKLPKEISK